jgi:hypothetical protein
MRDPFPRGQPPVEDVGEGERGVSHALGVLGLAAELEDLGGADITKALEELPMPSFVLDRDGVIRWVNESARMERGDTTGAH